MAEQACCITRRHSTKSHTFCLQITYEITRAYYLRFPYVTYSLYLSRLCLCVSVCVCVCFVCLCERICGTTKIGSRHVCWVG
jgi:hypothetical protein